MDYFEIDVPDDNILEIDIPEGTDESQYDALADDAKQDYLSHLTPFVDKVAGEATKAAVMPFTAPAQLLASKDPTQMPDADTVNTVAERTKKAWHAAGLPQRGLEGLTSLASDATGILRQGELPEGETWSSFGKKSLEKAADVTEERAQLPGAAGFLAGFLDPRYFAIGEVMNKPVAQGVTALAEKMQGPANWLAKRVLQFSKKMVGNQYSRGMADAASEFATRPHPEIQQAIMDLVETATPKATAKAAGPATSAGESLVRREGASVGDDFAKAAATEENGLTRIEPEGPILEGEVVGGPKGAGFDANAMADAEAYAPEGIDSLGKPTISALADTGDMYAHVDQQLKTVGKAIETTLEGLDNTPGASFDPKPLLNQLESMYKRNKSGSIIPPWDISAQGEYNQAVSKVINSIKAAALDNEGTINNLTFKEANTLKGQIQSMANYAKPKFDPENMMYSAGGAAVRDAIDTQGAKVMAQGGKDIQAFQSVRDAYSKLKIMEESLNNKFAGEESMKNVLPVVRTAGAITAASMGHYKTAMAILGEYLVREYGPQTGTQMLRSIAENAGRLGVGSGVASRFAPSTANAISEAFQGDELFSEATGRQAEGAYNSYKRRNEKHENKSQ